MNHEKQSLIVRSNRRRSIGLDADLVLSREHSAEVRYSAGVQLRDGGIPMTAVDMSEGGIGMMSACFLPKRSRGVLRVRDPRGGDAPIFEANVRVARTVMVDKRPGYQLGLLFEDSGEDFGSRLAAFIALADGAA